MGLLLVAGDVAAQPTEASGTVPVTERANRVFADTLLDDRITSGRIIFGAQRAWTWNHPAGSREPTAVRRIHLVGNVSVQLAGTEVRAERATVWMQRVPASRSGVAAELYQVFAYLEDARTPALSSGISRADRLGVQGMVIATSPPALRVDLGAGGRPEDRDETAFLDEAASGLLSTLRPEEAGDDPEGDGDAASGGAPAGETDGERETEPDRSVPTLDAPADTDTDPRAEPDRPAGPGTSADAGARAAVTDLPRIFPTGSVISINAGDRVSVDTIEGRRVVIATGGVIVQVAGGPAAPGPSSGTELTAQRAVLTFRGDAGDAAPGAGSFRAEQIDSIYLEGGVVAGDGSYTVRASRAYYDVPGDRGVVFDGVLWTYDQRRQLPVYVRADRFRQLARSRWDAEDAIVSNSPAPVPGIGVGVGSAVVDQRGADGGSGLRIEARDLTVRVGGAPVMYWPRYEGDASRPALRTIELEDSNREGFGIKTEWDMLALLSIEDEDLDPTDLSANGQLDYFSERGLGLGTTLSWTRPDGSGRLTGYIVPDDNGSDLLYNGSEIDRDGEVRGELRFEQRLRITSAWELITEAVWLSDETFLPAFDRDRGSLGRELVSRAVLQRTERDSLFTLSLSGTFLDFQPNEYLLQSQGYSVIKAPEARYVSGYRDVLSERSPGLLGYSWEASLGLMRLAFGEVTAESLGYFSDAQAMEALGIAANQSTGDALRAAGLNEDFVTRFDTRHELSAKLLAGAVTITPFLVGRVTLYDDGFEDFSPNESDTARFWGAAGVDLWTEFAKIDNTAFSRVFDISRLRHVVEPRLTVMVAGTSIEAVDLPVYDEEIESLADGVLLRAAVDQAWQTKRGGPGRWRTVDVLTLRTAYAWADDEAEDIDPDNEQSAFPDFVLFRPELSNPGEYVSAEGVWRMTEAVAFAGETVFDLDTNQQARTSAGYTVRHTPVFATSGEIRFLNPRDVTYGSVNAFYQLTEKYNTSLFAVYDFEQGDFQAIGAAFERRFPSGSFYLSISHNNINGETSFGVAFSPLGLRSRVGISGIGSENQQF